MKTIQSRIEGEFVQINDVIITEEQKLLLGSIDPLLQEDRQALIDLLNSQKTSPLNEADLLVVQTKYNEIKPILKGDDIYILLGLNAVINDNNTISGILNCRVNGDHKQIRF